MVNKPAFAEGFDVVLQAAPSDPRCLAKLHKGRGLLPFLQPSQQLQQD